MTLCKNCSQQIHKTSRWSHVELLSETTCAKPEPLFNNAVQQQVLEFHRAGGHTVNTSPTIIDFKTHALRLKLMAEEAQELVDAMYAGDIQAIAKELADLLYVVYGTAISYGLDMEPISTEVHRSNMTKFSEPGAYESTCDETSKSIRDAGGKTLKPACYELPNLAPIISKQLRGDADA